MPSIGFDTSVQRIQGRGFTYLLKLKEAFNDQRIVAAAAAQVMRRRVLPVLKQNLPVDTGRLRASLDFRKVDRRVELFGVEYRFHVLWRPFGEYRARASAYITIPELLYQIVQRDSRQIAREIINVIVRNVA